MKIHLLTFTSTPHDGSNGGYAFFASKRELLKRARDAKSKGYEVAEGVIHVTPTKAGIIHSLNVHASHADNG